MTNKKEGHPRSAVQSGDAPTFAERQVLAETIHKARWPADRQMAITPFEDEDRNGREYCFRIADAILASRPAAQAAPDPFMEDYKRDTIAGLIEHCAAIAEAIDSGRGNEKEIAKAIRALAHPSAQCQCGITSEGRCPACLTVPSTHQPGEAK